MRREREVLGRLYVEYHQVNGRHFAGLLPSVPMDITPIQRPKGKVGMVACTQCSYADNRVLCILFDRKFVQDKSWPDITEALMHEMVHVWQAVRGERPNHGISFRTMARRLNISERAVD